MSIDKTRALIVLVWFVIGGICGFFIGKAKYNVPLVESVTRDTVVVVDTAYYDRPIQKDSVRTRYVTRWLPAKRDTISNTVTMWAHDTISNTVAVEVPITSKHYSANEYDAWVSGYEASLDSIKVYQRTEYITERVTLSKPPNKWELDLVGGINYNFNKKKYTPYAGGELLYKPNRLQVGIRGGVIKTDKTEPFAGAVVRYRIF